MDTLAKDLKPTRVLVDKKVAERELQMHIFEPEGSHFGYALQWFTFAVILFVGYPFYLKKQE